MEGTNSPGRLQAFCFPAASAIANVSALWTPMYVNRHAFLPEDQLHSLPDVSLILDMTRVIL